MRVILLVVTSLLLFSLPGTGQNYQTVYPQEEKCFINKDDNFLCLRIDSVLDGATTILYPSRINLNTFDECYSPVAGSWIAKAIEINDNGENVFINYAGDAVMINTLASLDEEWVVYEVPGNMQIRATLVAHELMDFMELTDSVKTIAFQAYDSEGEPLEMDVNEMTVKVSKHYGWVQALSFYFFPDFQALWYGPNMGLDELYLAGLSEPQVGVQNLMWFDVYDFQPGDVMHVIEENGYWVGQEDGYFQTTETRSVFEYIDRIDHVDSIEYCYVLNQCILQLWTDSISVSSDTLNVIINPNPFFDQLPYTAVPYNDDSEVPEYYTYFEMNMGEFYQKLDHSFVFEQLDSSCWQMMTGWSLPSVKYYYEALGGPFYPREAAFGQLVRRELAYYEKDGISWGTPLDVTDVEDYTVEAFLSIFPNPAQDFFTVSIAKSFHDKLSLRLMDVNNRSVHYQKVQSGNNIINVSHLKAGIYFCIIINERGVVYSRKLIIQ